MTLSKRSALVVGLAALVLLAVSGAVWWWNTQHSSRELVFAIPPGTAARQAAGERVEVFPATITLALDRYDTLVIRNDDTQAVTIGPFRVEPGQRFTQRYYNPGTFDLLCTIHQGQRLRIIVQRTGSGL